jgi:phenylacetate-CoA ligase
MNAGYYLIDRVRRTEILKHYSWLCSFNGTGTDLARLQTGRLVRLLSTLKETNVFYKPLLADVTLQQIQEAPHQILRNLPVMDKPSVQSNRSVLRTVLANRFEQAKQTGGSTGVPFRYWWDAESISLSWGYILYCWHRYADYSPGDPFATIAGHSLRSVKSRIKESAYHFLQNNFLIPAESIEPDMPVDQGRLEKIKLLFAYPTALHNLVLQRPEFIKHCRRLRAIFTTSEQLQPGVRQAIEAAFGVSVFDLYGANDGGLISCEDESHNGFLYHPLNCLVEEYRNEEGCKELLLTSLNSWTFPLIRYRVGDLADAEQPGQSPLSVFPRISNLKGRARDLIRLPSGKTVHGSAFNGLFYRFPQIARYRIVQQAGGRLEAEVQLSGGDIIPGELYDQLAGLVGREVPVEVRAVMKFPASDRKFKVIESHVI